MRPLHFLVGLSPTIITIFFMTAFVMALSSPGAAEPETKSVDTLFQQVQGYQELVKTFIPKTNDAISNLEIDATGIEDAQLDFVRWTLSLEFAHA